MWTFSRFVIVQFSVTLPHWDWSIHTSSEANWMIWTKSPASTVGNRLERDSKKSPAADSSLGLLFIHQQVQTKVQNASSQVSNRGDQRLSDVRSCFCLPHSACWAQAGTLNLWLGDSGAGPSLLLHSELLKTRHTLLDVSSRHFTSPAFADLSAQLVVFSKLWLQFASAEEGIHSSCHKPFQFKRPDSECCYTGFVQSMKKTHSLLRKELNIILPSSCAIF